MSATNIPSSAGIGLRAPHVAEFRTRRPHVPFIEVHTENHLCGGPMRRVLHELRPDYPISLHCVGLSIGSAHDMDASHLERVRVLANEIDPLLVSDHLSAAILDGLYTNDLLPIPYTEEALAVAACHVDRIQEALGRQILIENPSTYIAFATSELDEGTFLSQLARRTGCGILCDVNNIYVSARNRGVAPHHLLSSFDQTAVKEIHIAGHVVEEDCGGTILVDTHDRRVCDAVLALYAAAMRRFGPTPSLVEWDSALPDLDVLLDEAERVQASLRQEGMHAYA